MRADLGHRRNQGRDRLVRNREDAYAAFPTGAIVLGRRRAPSERRGYPVRCSLASKATGDDPPLPERPPGPASHHEFGDVSISPALVRRLGRHELWLRYRNRKGDTVPATVLYMSMSLDGFIAGPNAGPGNGLGDGGRRLHGWFLTGADADHKATSARPAGVNGQVVGEFMATGAVVAGRGAVEPAGYWGGDHHDGVSIFVLSRREAGSETGQWPLVTFVNDVRTAMSEAKRAAGDKNVLVHGAGTAQLALAAGVLDELEIHLVPVLLGQGRRLFDNLDPEHIELERTRILQGEAGVTHMHYRVQR
jgi:dihydrofolate reductase